MICSCLNNAGYGTDVACVYAENGILSVHVQTKGRKITADIGPFEFGDKAPHPIHCEVVVNISAAMWKNIINEDEEIILIVRVLINGIRNPEKVECLLDEFDPLAG